MRDIDIRKNKATEANLSKLRKLQKGYGDKGRINYYNQYIKTFGYDDDFNINVYWACLENYEDLSDED